MRSKTLVNGCRQNPLGSRWPTLLPSRRTCQQANSAALTYEDTRVWIFESYESGQECRIERWLDLEPPGAAHRAVVAGFPARFDAAHFFFFKEIHELADRCFFNAKSLLTRM